MCARAVALRSSAVRRNSTPGPGGRRSGRRTRPRRLATRGISPASRCIARHVERCACANYYPSTYCYAACNPHLSPYSSPLMPRLRFLRWQHLGHVFTWPAGPDNPTGIRYCIDGVCLRKVTSAALAAAGGAYVDALPVILPELVVLPVMLVLLVSCVGSCVTGGELLCVCTRDRKQQSVKQQRGARASEI